MRVSVTGNDTLAKTVAASLAANFDVKLNEFADPDVLWVCYDTPERGDSHEADTNFIIRAIGGDLSQITPRTFVLISSQIPVGTTARLERAYPAFDFGYSPENIRVNSAMEDFAHQERIIVGVRSVFGFPKALLRQLLSPYTDQIIFTSPETAEFVKHALNGWLAMNIAYANEIAVLADAEGADAAEVMSYVQMDARVGKRAPLKPGNPFGGGHLERELTNLRSFALAHDVNAPLIFSIDESNEATRKRKL